MPPTVNKKLHSRSVLNQIRLLRFSNAVTQKILKFLQEVDSSLTDAIGKRLLNIKTSGVSPDTYKNKRLQALQQFVRSVINKQSKDLYDIMKPALIDTANKELNWQVENIADVLPVKVDVVTPSKPLLESLVTENPFEGKVLQDWVSGWETGKAERVLAEIKKGMAEGQAAEDIVTRLVGTKALQYSDGVLDISRRGARALVRTTVNGLATSARELFYSQNKDIIKGVQWVSTLDSRTTPICQARDGKVYPVDSGPRPPAHVNCRSTTSPVMKSWQDMGIDLKEVPEGTRPYVVKGVAGDVPASMTYEEWLKEQSEEVQKDILGQKKYDLWKNGATLGSFVDETTGKSKKL